MAQATILDNGWKVRRRLIYPLQFIPRQRRIGGPKLEKLDIRWVTTLPSPVWFSDLEARGCAVYR